MKQSSKKINDKILCILLLSLSFLLMLALFFTKDKSFSEKENRSLKTMPRFTLESVTSGKYFSEFSRYCQDQFPSRDFFTSASSIIDLSMRRNESNGIIVVKDKKLISRHDYEDHEILKENLRAISSFIEKNNTRELPTFIAVAPRSIDVNTEALPIFFPQNYGKLEYRELYSFIPKSSLIDTYQALKNNYDDFYNTDHHWTTNGAYLAYVEIAKKLGVEPYHIDYFNIETVSKDFLGTSFSRSGLFDFKNKDSILLYRYENDDNLTIKSGEKFLNLYDTTALKTNDKYRVFLGGNTDLLQIRNQEKKPKLLLIKDSFANSVIPFLSLHFDIDVIDLRYYMDSVSSHIEKNDFDSVLLLYGIDTIATEESCYRVEK